MAQRSGTAPKLQRNRFLTSTSRFYSFPPSHTHCSNLRTKHASIPSALYMMLFPILLFSVRAVAATFYDNPDQDPLIVPPALEEQPYHGWQTDSQPYARPDGPSSGRGSASAHTPDTDEWSNDWPFSGLSTFAHLDYARCLSEPDVKFDIAIVGAPYDTSVSYRPGARFGPRAIRQGSARQSRMRAFHPQARIDPYGGPLKVIDCGDIPISPFSQEVALGQMTRAFTQLLGREVHTQPLPAPYPNHESAAAASSSSGNVPVSARPRRPPRLVTLGGDHSISLPQLRALSAAYNTTLAVLHLDAHLDTWDPRRAYPGDGTDATAEAATDAATDAAAAAAAAARTAPTLFTHGSMLWLAHREGLLRAGSLVHAGLRTRLQGPEDEVSDTEQGWTRLDAGSIDELGGAKAVADAIVRRIGTEHPVYLTLDIDVLDPSVAPGTGTPEAGGWSARELLAVLRGVEGLNVVAADVVEVSPAYDGRGEQTAVVAAQAVYEILTSMALRGGWGVGN